MTFTEPRVDVERCLARMRDQSAALAGELRELSAAAWGGPTNCPPWRVRDLAAHIVSSGEGVVGSIQAGLAGSLAPGLPPEQRARRQAELEAADPAGVASAVEKVTDDIDRIYSGLSDEQLGVICFHRRGNRSVRWYVAHRLAEVAFHRWDLLLSLGRTPEFDEDVAALLLSTLIESNAPRTYAAGLSDERGHGERYLLAVRDDPETRWLVQIDPDALRVMNDDGSAAATITACAADLALLIYGRADLRSPGFSVDGDLTVASRFTRVFPRP